MSLQKKPTKDEVLPDQKHPCFTISIQAYTLTLTHSSLFPLCIPPQLPPLLRRFNKRVVEHIISGADGRNITGRGPCQFLSHPLPSHPLLCLSPSLSELQQEKKNHPYTYTHTQRRISPPFTTPSLSSLQEGIIRARSHANKNLQNKAIKRQH